MAVFDPNYEPAMFGRIITPDVVEDAVRDSLIAWMPAYLREIERQRGLEPGVLPAVRSWSVVNEFRHWPEEHLPAGIVISPGTTDVPKTEGDGTLRAKWIVGVAIIISTHTQSNTNFVAKLYGGAVMAAVLQHSKLGDLGAMGVDLTAQRFDPIREEQGRSLATVNSVFTVDVRGMMNVQMGPRIPPDDPLTEPVLPYIEERPETIVKSEEA